jgi:superfamily II DNA/RNA helicase
VFVNTKIGCDRLARQLASTGLRAPPCTRIGRRKIGRGRWNRSHRAASRCSVATDVAARGLDIEDVTLIVNYEVRTGLIHTSIASAGRDVTNHLAMR